MGLWQKIANTFRPRRLEDDIADELNFHLEERERENCERGMSQEEAYSAARRRFGNLTLARERTTESDLVRWADTVLRDVRLAVRLLAKSPAFTATALLTLALGVGANTAVFTLMKLIVVDALPVRQPEQLVVLHDSGPQFSAYGNRMGNSMSSAFSYPLYRDLNTSTGEVFSGVLARAEGRFTAVTLTTPNDTERLAAEMVSGNYFSLLGVQPWRGRLLSEADNEPTSIGAVVLSYAFWKRQFGGDPAVVNHKIVLNKFPFVVAGITPPGFYGISLGGTTDVYVPVAMTHRLQPNEDDPVPDRNYAWLSLVGRLKPGVTIQQAQSALTVIYPPLRDKQLASINAAWPEFLKNFKRRTIELTPGGKGYSSLREELQKPLVYVFAMTGIFLVITLVNITNLMIARGSRRKREMAVRLSLGAPRGALVRQLLIESCLLAGVGGGCGIALAYLGTPLLIKQFNAQLSQAGVQSHPDILILSLSLAVSLACGLLFGLAPALQSARTRVAENLKRETGSHTSRAGWGRRVLVAGQVALSFVLLASALLLTFSLRNLRHIDLGFQTDNLLRFKLDAAAAGYSQASAITFAEDVRQAALRVHGVQNVALAEVPIMENSDAGVNVNVEGYQPPTHADAQCRRDRVSSSFFATLGIPFVAGRPFSEGEMQKQYRVAVVNQMFVRHFLPGRNPIGVRFAVGGGSHGLQWIICGVVRNSEYLGIGGHVEPLLYTPYPIGQELHELTYYVRKSGPESMVVPQIRNVVQRLDKHVAVAAVSSMSELIDDQLFAERSLSFAAGVFAILACLLAAVGLYGVMAYTVAQRRREFGIRLAVGATPRSISTIVLREGGVVGLAGLVLGVPCALATSKLGRNVLYGLQRIEVDLWATAAAGILLIAVLATLIPARLAATTNPQKTLRED